MLFAGLQKTSLIDYPNKICAVVFTRGCNFRCPYCHNPELVLSKNKKILAIHSEAEILTFLSKRRKVIDGLVITGGEPLLYKTLSLFLHEVKKLGMLVKLDTNGSFPDRLEKILSARLIDYIAMDIKSSWEKYCDVAKVNIGRKIIEKSIDLIMDSGLDYEFRTTLISRFHTIEEVVKIAKMIQGAKNYYLQNFSNQGKLLDKALKNERPFTDNELKKFKHTAERFVKKCGIR